MGRERKAYEYVDMADKIGKEPMTSYEMADYIKENLERYKEKTTEVESISRNINRYIKTLCDESKGVLKLEYFLKDSTRTNKIYIIPPEVHGLLLILFDSDYFQKNDYRKLENRDKIDRQFINNINKYADDIDKKVFEVHPAYINIFKETPQIQLYLKSSYEMFNILLTADLLVRDELMKEASVAVSALQEQFLWESVKAHYIINKKYYSGERAKQSEVICANSIPDCIVGLMAYYLDNSNNKSEKIIHDEIISVLKQMNVETISMAKDEVKNELNQTYYLNKAKDVMQKAKIFDLSDEFELMTYRVIESFCDMYSSPCYDDNYKLFSKVFESRILSDRFTSISDIVKIQNSDIMNSDIRSQKDISES